VIASLPSDHDLHTKVVVAPSRNFAVGRRSRSLMATASSAPSWLAIVECFTPFQVLSNQGDG